MYMIVHKRGWEIKTPVVFKLKLLSRINNVYNIVSKKVKVGC